MNLDVSSSEKTVNISITDVLGGNQRVQNEIQVQCTAYSQLEHNGSSPVAGETSTDMGEIILSDIKNEKETGDAKEYLNAAPNNSEVAVLKKDSADGERTKTRNSSDTFENANPLLLQGGEFDMDPIVCEKIEKLPMDAETEMLSSAATEIKIFLTKCNLEMGQKEWANESVFQEAEILEKLLSRYKCLTKELRCKVIEKFIELNCINIFNDFFLFSLKTCSTVYEKNEEYFLGEIIALEEQNIDNSLNEKISNFNVLLYTQRILSSMMIVVTNCTDGSFTFCTMCMEGEFISTIFRLLELYVPIKDDEELKVCFLINRCLQLYGKKFLNVLKRQKCKSKVE